MTSTTAMARTFNRLVASLSPAPVRLPNPFKGISNHLKAIFSFILKFEPTRAIILFAAENAGNYGVAAKSGPWQIP
jgi:hypothetical protein